MCLIVVAWQRHPDYPLVVAANRDEFHSRPTAPAHWWTDMPDLLAGRDLEAGGTWMGLTRQGRFAALTNYRDPNVQRPGAPSRGALVRDSLADPGTPLDCLTRLATERARYAPFNLLVGDGHELGILESTTGATRRLPPGLYGLSNHLLDTPWPKLTAARQRLEAALPHLPDEAAVLAMLRDSVPAADACLPHTGVSLAWERWLSSIFIRAPGYGTRSSTLITIDRHGQARLREWTWDADGQAAGEQRHDFAIAPQG